jgi:hypothetical protein
MTYTILILALGAAMGADGTLRDATAGPAANPAVMQQGGGQQQRPQQAQQGRGQQQRPQQAQQGRAQQQRPQQAQQGRGQEQRPQQAQQGRGQQQRPQQAQQGRGQQQRPQQAQQGRGQQQRPQQAQPQGRGQPPELQRQRVVEGRGAAGAARGHTGRVEPVIHDAFRALAGSTRLQDRLVAGSLARGTALGLDPTRLVIRQQSDQIIVMNAAGVPLVNLPDRRASQLGHWTLYRLSRYPAQANAPAFCRSGAGHPVWGREWCLQRGHGLGGRTGTIWSRTRVDDIVFRRAPTRERLARDVLIGVLGDVVVNRLALHSLALGYDQPLHGQWLAEPSGPQILHIYSGDVVIAEIVDWDRNNRADMLYVVQRY